MVVNLPGSGQQLVSAEAIRGGSTSHGSYTLRARAGEAGQPETRPGMTVRAVIELAAGDPDASGFLTVPRADGSTAYLPLTDFSEPPPFPEGPALIAVDQASIRFFRPLFEPSNLNEVNAEDNIATTSGEALTIGIREGNLLTVQASASPSSADAGQVVRFGASASGAKEGESVSFRWSFGDGATAEGATVTHAFGGSGTYEARVTAVGSEKMAVYDDLATEERIRVMDKGVEPNVDDDLTRPPMSYRYGDITSPYVASDEPLAVQDAHFARCLATGARPNTDGANGLAVVEVLEAAQLSLGLNRPVWLNEIRGDVDLAGPELRRADWRLVPAPRGRLRDRSPAARAEPGLRRGQAATVTT